LVKWAIENGCEFDKGSIDQAAMSGGDNQASLETLTQLGYLEYTLRPQCAVCTGQKSGLFIHLFIFVKFIIYNGCEQ
jgi:hypothetical protein